jgi:hypothetical protein
MALAYEPTAEVGGPSVGPDPDPKPLSDATMLDEWMQGLRKASQILSSNSDCADLFGGGGPYPDPGTVLAQIANSYKFDSIEPTEPNTVTSATVTGNGQMPYGYGGVIYASVTITLNNTSPGASFVSGTLNDWTATILHELGHAIYDLYGTPSDQIKPDQGNTAKSEANTALIKQKCKL